jgi:hypothetical protein
MKYIKKYENFDKVPKIGDYVLMRTDSKNIDFRNFLKNNFGQIVKIGNSLVNVKYELSINKEIFYFFDLDCSRSFNKKKIVAFSDNLDDLKLQLQFPETSKYNI